VDDTFAGQEVACPECQSPVKVPARASAPKRTSGYALASFVIALMGAFTPFTALALVLGILGLVHVRRYPDRLTGGGFAVAGIVLSAIFGGLTLFKSGDASRFLRARRLAAFADTSGPLEIVEPREGFAITRPSDRWGKIDPRAVDEPIVLQFRRGKPINLMLVCPNEVAFLDLHTIDTPNSLFRVADEVVNDLAPTRRHVRPVDPDDEDLPRPRSAAKLRSKSLVTVGNGLENCTLEMDVPCHGRQWRFFTRLYRREGERKVFVVHAYAESGLWPKVEEQVRGALDTFRVLP
jgi:hypothetical protein